MKVYKMESIMKQSKIRYSNYIEAGIKVHKYTMWIGQYFIVLCVTIKYPSFDFEIWREEEYKPYRSGKRVYQKAWFSKRFNTQLTEEVRNVYKQRGVKNEESK